MKTTERLLTILRILREAPDGLATSTDIKAAMGVYEGADGQRSFGRDLSALKDRGLIDTRIATDRTPNFTGVRIRARPCKPTDLHLTADEHGALRSAREATRGSAPPGRSHRGREGPLEPDVADASVHRRTRG
jgi:hypothetical protein